MNSQYCLNIPFMYLLTTHNSSDVSFHFSCPFLTASLILEVYFLSFLYIPNISPLSRVTGKIASHSLGYLCTMLDVFFICRNFLVCYNIVFLILDIISCDTADLFRKPMPMSVPLSILLILSSSRLGVSILIFRPLTHCDCILVHLVPC